MTERENSITNDLKSLFISLDEAVITLKQSLSKCQDLLIKKNDLSKMDLDEWDAFEALCSRFSRVSDILVKEVFRMIDLLEIKEEGTVIDALNRAEKREIIESASEFRDLRATRNKIAHEYTKDELEDVFISVMNFTPKLLEAYNNSRLYFETLQKKLTD